MMSASAIAQFVLAAVNMPKNIEISDVLINRK
jgi:NADP-dependent 3-hydroxy acid dehydrogenase YdfG